MAIATTGNVFLADSVKGGKDLVNDVRFKRCVYFVELTVTLGYSFTCSFPEKMSLHYRILTVYHLRLCHLLKQRRLL